MNVRRPTPADAEAFGPWWSLARRSDTVALVCEVGGAVAGAGVLDPTGTGTLPAHPVIRLHPEAGPAGTGALESLVENLLAAAGRAGSVTITWDPMDASGLRRLGLLGFRPTGDMPYFELGGGQVQYVSGYTDATGSRLDLIRGPS